MQRMFTWSLAAVLVACILAAGTVAVACTADSEGLELINGELPGGG
jgi:hypothetical protein